MTGILVHEWISETGGSEKVFDAMVEAFPKARILTLWNDGDEHRYGARTIQESWLARTSLRRHKSLALPFMPTTWRHRRGPAPDWALVSTHLFAHHVRFDEQRDTFRKYLYVHTPARYIWNPELDSRGAHLAARAASPWLRALDRRRAQEATAIAANSDYVRARIRSAWGRESTVIHPPVDVERILAVTDWSTMLTEPDQLTCRSIPAGFILGASRFIPYKRLDLVIRMGEVANTPVVIAGAGPERPALAALASRARVPVTIVDRPSDELLYALFQAASIYVFPPVEDFGMMPVEAMAAGCPVVVNTHGGAGESVQDGVSGVHTSFTGSIATLRDAVERARGIDPRACRTRAVQFSRARFIERIQAWISTGENSSQPGHRP